jgi:4-hydroxyacetophenone monooxygenase
VSERGIVVADGAEHDVDVIVFATGFKTSDYLWRMEVRGREGVRIEELWSKDGPRAYLGTMLPGFPNFFMIYGPNTNGVGGFSVLEFQEMVTRFVLKCLATLVLQGKDFVDVKPEAYWRFNEEQDRADALKVYNWDKSVRSYYTHVAGDRRRSVTNGALDIRLLWHWLRDPANDPSLCGGPAIDQRLAEISEDLAVTSRAVEPYFGRDLTIG